jgi:serine/threonine-protein kinase
MTMIRARQKLGKYRIERKLGEGGFAAVYSAVDMIEGVRVALKIPFPQYVDKGTLEDFRREVRLVARLNHPNILPLKNAEFIDGQLIVVFPLGDRSLADRLQHRLSTPLALDFVEQILDAVAYAHERRIIHCDIKPENLILFPDNRLLLTDFGIAKVARRTIQGSGSGTVGYVAPEQAMGRPSFRSDVFSIGLISYRMFGGHWPAWPFHWPPPGFVRVCSQLNPTVVDLLRRSLEIDPRKRFRDAVQMLSSFRRVKRCAIQRSGPSHVSNEKQSKGDWRTVRFRQFRNRYGKSLGTSYACDKCYGPISESMRWCPWCQETLLVFAGETRFPQYCPRCHRGMKLDWRYCPWCYGPGFQTSSRRQYDDVRYVARCTNPKCHRKALMAFMRYCPWCRRKVRRKWKLSDTSASCTSCGWGVAENFWACCPWCGTGI